MTLRFYKKTEEEKIKDTIELKKYFEENITKSIQ
jgi:hypothetical protein